MCSHSICAVVTVQLQSHCCWQVELLQGGRELVGKKEPPSTHFGHDVIPQALREKKKVVAHHYDGYWRVGLCLCSSSQLAVLEQSCQLLLPTNNLVACT